MPPKNIYRYSMAMIASLALILSIVSPVYAAVQVKGIPDLSLRSNIASLMGQAQSSGAVRVMVMLKPSGQAAGQSSASLDRTEQGAMIEETQAGLLSRISGYDPLMVKRFSTIPAMALSVDAAGLAQLAADSSVVSIELDQLAAPFLSQSVPLIGASVAQSSGFTGSGQVVAVLDTGVDKTHPFLSGRVVSEACYSTTASGISTSICPDGVSQTIAPDSALPYATGVCPPGRCDHGTHVAGIIAGNATAAFNQNGVAPDAHLIAIQVFSRFDSSVYCPSGTPCVMSYASDQILGLERVYELHTSYAIAAVNLSLGGGEFADQVSCDAANPEFKGVVDELRSVGIATVIAAGNNGYSDSLSAPACISSAFSVGSSGDGSGSTPLDSVCQYSNSAPFLSFLAPGDSIYSSIPGNSYESMRGTSMAAPHVAGAWALVKSRYPNYSVSQVADLLTSSGKQITDARTGVTTPRIELDQILVITFSLTGHVALGETGLSGVTLMDNSGQAATTDASGNFTLTGLIPGTHTLIPSKSTYAFLPGKYSVQVGPGKDEVTFIAVPLTYSYLPLLNNNTPIH